MLLQKRDVDTWKLSGDRTPTMSSSVIATKLSGVTDVWKVPPTKTNNGLALDSSAFRPPNDVGAPTDTTSLTDLYSSHSTIPGGATDTDNSSERCLMKKSQKRSRSPSESDVMSETQSKFLTVKSSHTPSLTAVDTFSRDESVYNVSRRQFSPAVDNRRRVEEFYSDACSLLPLCHEYQSSADGSKSLQLLPRQDVAGVHTIPTTCVTSSVAATNQTSQSSVLSPVAASPYFPFFTSTPPSNISGLYYPNPYVMLSTPPLAYQQTPPHFPRGWISSVVGGTELTPSKVIAERMQQLDSQAHQQLHRGPPTSAAFDFPWMRENLMQTTQSLPRQNQMYDLYEGHLAAASKQSFGFNQYMLMRNVGAALVSDGLEMYRQPSCDLPSNITANRALLDNHPTSYLGIYPPLFHPPYLGVHSR